MENFDIEFYETENGKCPVKEFVEEQDEAMKAAILQVIDLLAEYGNMLEMPHSKYLKDGIIELRVKVAPKITRILYFFTTGKKAVLTNGFLKKTRTTPSEEIEKALKYKKDYLSR